MKHSVIKRFQIEGQTKELLGARELLTRTVVDGMRDSGYVQRIDIDTVWTVSYNGKSYDYKLSVYGVYVGRQKALCIKYIDSNTIIYTHQPKSKEHSALLK